MKWDIYIRIFFYIISFVGVLIHNEIVIINICAKYFLDLKVKNEVLYSDTDDPVILKRYEILKRYGRFTR